MFCLQENQGNVNVTVSDRKHQHSVVDTVQYYTADILSATDYYPFGMQMVGRNFSSDKYRFGFNGKENDNDVKGEGNQLDYGMRIYDPKVGRFLSLDPLIHNFPALSPYQYASNNPVEGSDLDGMEYVSSKHVRIQFVRGILMLKVENMSTVIKNGLKIYNENSNNWRIDPKTGWRELGPDYSIARIDWESSMPKFPTFDTDPADANPNNFSGRVATTTQTTTGQEFPTRKEVTTASPGGAKGFAYLQIAMILVENGINLYLQNNQKSEFNLVNTHIGAFKLAAADVNFALKKTTMIPKNFQTEEYISDIVNVVLSGESYVSKYDEVVGARLKQIGMAIYNTYSIKRIATTQTVETSQLDGVSISKTVTIPNPSYDFKYVKENPPIDEVSGQ